MDDINYVLPETMGTFDAGSDGALILIKTLETLTGKTYNYPEEWMVGKPEVLLGNNRIVGEQRNSDGTRTPIYRNTKVFITPKASTGNYGSTALFYNRMALEEVKDLKISNEFLNYDTQKALTEINTKTAYGFTLNDLKSFSITPADGYGYSDILMAIKEDDLRFTGILTVVAEGAYGKPGYLDGDVYLEEPIVIDDDHWRIGDIKQSRNHPGVKWKLIDSTQDIEIFPYENPELYATLPLKYQMVSTSPEPTSLENFSYPMFVVDGNRCIVLPVFATVAYISTDFINLTPIIQAGVTKIGLRDIETIFRMHFKNNVIIAEVYYSNPTEGAYIASNDGGQSWYELFKDDTLNFIGGYMYNFGTRLAVIGDDLVIAATRFLGKDGEGKNITEGCLFFSQDGFITMTKQVKVPIPASSELYSIEVSGDAIFVTYNGTGQGYECLVSFDVGDSWTTVRYPQMIYSYTNKFHAIGHRIYLTSSGGQASKNFNVWYTDDNGLTWTEIINDRTVVRDVNGTIINLSDTNDQYQACEFTDDYILIVGNDRVVKIDYLRHQIIGYPNSNPLSLRILNYQYFQKTHYGLLTFCLRENNETYTPVFLREGKFLSKDIVNDTSSYPDLKEVTKINDSLDLTSSNYYIKMA